MARTETTEKFLLLLRNATNKDSIFEIKAWELANILSDLQDIEKKLREVDNSLCGVIHFIRGTNLSRGEKYNPILADIPDATIE